MKPVPRVEALSGDVIKAFARAPGLTSDELLQIAQQVVSPDKASLTQAGLGFVEICLPGWTRPPACSITEQLGLSPEEVLVFGDMPNDIPMFTWAGWRRVAVANAHPSVRMLADEITLSNDDHGVAVWLSGCWSELAESRTDPPSAGYGADMLFDTRPPTGRGP